MKNMSNQHPTDLALLQRQIEESLYMKKVNINDSTASDTQGFSPYGSYTAKLPAITEVYADLPFANGDLLFTEIINVGADKYDMRIVDYVGSAGFYNEEANDIRNLEVIARTVTGYLGIGAVSTSETIYDPDRDRLLSGNNHPTKASTKSNFTARAMAKLWDDSVQFGGSTGRGSMIGLYNNDDVTESLVPTTGDNDTLWVQSDGSLAKTFDQIYEDIFYARDTVLNASKGAVRPNLCLISARRMHILQRVLNINSRNLMSVIQEAMPEVRFVPIYQLENDVLINPGPNLNPVNGPGGPGDDLIGDMLIMMNDSQEYVTKIVAQGITTLPTEIKYGGLKRNTYTIAKFGGTEIKMPFAVTYMKNI